MITIEAPRLYNVHKSTLDASSTQWRHFQTRSRSGILLSNRWILLSLHYCLRVAASCFKQSWTRCIVCSSAERIVVPNHCLVHARRVRFCIRSLLQRDSHVARLSHTYIPTHNPRSSLREKINYIYILLAILFAIRLEFHWNDAPFWGICYWWSTRDPLALSVFCEEQLGRIPFRDIEDSVLFAVSGEMNAALTISFSPSANSFSLNKHAILERETVLSIFQTAFEATYPLTR